MSYEIIFINEIDFGCLILSFSNKEFIEALCNPESIEELEFKKEFIIKLDTEKVNRDLMLTYQVVINVENSNRGIMIVQGKINKIDQVKLIMEIEYENYSDIKPVHNSWLINSTLKDDSHYNHWSSIALTSDKMMASNTNYEESDESKETDEENENDFDESFIQCSNQFTKFKIKEDDKNDNLPKLM